jgi:hypothetical protein
MGMPQLQMFVPASKRSEGRSFEQLVLGPSVGYDGNNKERMSFQDSLVRSVERQPPGYPWGEFRYQIKDVYRAVQLHLPEKDREYLMLFSALETPLDYVFNIDCLFHLRGAVVSVDLTLAPEKKKIRHPTHLLFTDDTLGSDNLLREFAERTASHLTRRTKTVSFWVFRAMMRHRK